jgi:hypothetical protein
MELLVTTVRTQNTMPRAGSINLIWNNTTSGSLLRSWILDVAAHSYIRGTFAEHIAIFPADFVLQFALRLLPEQFVNFDSAYMASALKYLEVEVID